MPKSPEFDSALTPFKESLSKQLLAGFTILCIVALPLSLFRWAEIGFHFVFIHHILITAMVCLCYLNRRKTSYKLDLSVIAISLGSMIVSGILTFGMQSGVITFAPVVCVLVALITNIRIAILTTIVWTAFLFITGYLFSHDVLAFQVAPEIYAKNMSAWYIMAIGSLISISILLITAKLGLHNLLGLIEKIHEQKREISYLADHDYMTGYKVARLATPLMEQNMASAKRNKTKLALVFVDLNDFKSINDNFGHTVGDEVIKITAENFKKSLREVDSTVRVGGDEFLFILPEIKNKEDIEAILHRMTLNVNRDVRVNGHNIFVEASLGVAVYPDDAENPNKLRYFADMAMYAAKNNSTNTPVYYSDIPITGSEPEAKPA